MCIFPKANKICGWEKITGHSGFLRACAIGGRTNNRPLISTASDDNTVQIWDIKHMSSPTFTKRPVSYVSCSFSCTNLYLCLNKYIPFYVRVCGSLGLSCTFCSGVRECVCELCVCMCVNVCVCVCVCVFPFFFSFCCFFNIVFLCIFFRNIIILFVVVLSLMMVAWP